METKNMQEVVENKIKAKLARGYTNVCTATERMMAEGKIAKDFIFEVGTERKGVETTINFLPDNIGKVTANFKMSKEEENFLIHPHAIRQVTEKLKIPTTYLTTLLYGSQEWQQTLGYEILNTHNEWTDRNKVLVRAVGNEVRAFLSDQYRRLNSEMIFGAHIDEIYKNGGQLSDGWMDDTRVMVESLLPAPIQVQTQLNGVIFLAFGTKMVTSDYGDGALDLRSFVLQGVCLNGMVRESVLRSVHLGAKLPDNLALSQKTYELDSMTTASAIRDLTKNLYSSDVIKTRMLEIKAASDLVMDPVRELKQLQGLGKLLKGETDEIGQLLMRNNPEDGVQGESTLWKLTQGITSYANRESVSERRKMELQEIAGNLFEKIKS
jgi:hypothetical protein